MGFFTRLLGICQTKPPADAGCWTLTGETIEIDLNRVPELAAPGGAIRIEGGGLGVRVLVFRGDDGRFHALPNRCTHAAHRRLDVVSGQGKVRCCSVGQSEFAYDGRRLAGAAHDPIQPLVVEVQQNRLRVRLRT